MDPNSLTKLHSIPITEDTNTISFETIPKSTKYDHVESKVKQYRMEIRKQTEKSRKKTKSLDTITQLDTDLNFTRTQERHSVNEDYKAICNQQKDQIENLLKEVATYQTRLDAMRIELSESKALNTQFLNVRHSHEHKTPLKMFSDVLLTPVRSFSSSFMRTLSKSETKPTNNNISFSSDSDLDSDDACDETDLRSDKTILKSFDKNKKRGFFRRVSLFMRKHFTNKKKSECDEVKMRNSATFIFTNESHADGVNQSNVAHDHVTITKESYGRLFQNLKEAQDILSSVKK